MLLLFAKLAVVECSSTFADCRFAAALTGPPRDVLVSYLESDDPSSVSNLWLALVRACEVAADLLRLAWLLAIFTPLVLAAGPALYWGWHRDKWMTMLR